MTVSALYTGGTIVPMNGTESTADGLAVSEGRVVACGDLEEARAALPGDYVEIDLAGRTICPGFIDAHNHLLQSVLDELGIDCRPEACAELSDIYDRIEHEAGSLPPGAWVRAWGYDEVRLRDARNPTRRELDAIAPHHPVVVVHTSRHHCVANSAALSRVALAQADDDPSDQATGLLFENAAELVDGQCRDELMATREDDLVRAAATVAARYYGYGITRVCDPAVPPQAESLYERLTGSDGVALRVEALGIGSKGAFVPPRERLAGAHRHASEGRFAVSGVKLFLDGAEQCAICLSPGQGIRAAAGAVVESVRRRSLVPLQLMRQGRAHIGIHGVRSGILFYERAALDEVIVQARGHRSIAMHALGNAAIKQALDAVETGRQTHPDAPFRIEHAMIASARDLPRFAELNVPAVVQPRFIHDFGFMPLATGLSRPLRVLALRDLIDTGALVVGSSDAPVCEPDVLAAMQSALTRRTNTGDLLDPAQAITASEALSLYTTNAARSLGVSGRAGALTAGADADFVVLGENPLTAAPEHLGAVEVVATYIGGSCVHGADLGGATTRRSSTRNRDRSGATDSRLRSPGSGHTVSRR